MPSPATFRTICAALGAAACLAGAAAWADVTVFAAASTTRPLQEIAKAYGAKTGTGVTPVFAASGALARQIDQGAPADLFLSANVKWMDWLASRERIELRSRLDLLANCLALIQPAGAAPTLHLDKTLATALKDERLAIGDPAFVPAGAYARAALESLGLWHDLQPLAARLPSVRHVLALVGRGEAAAGFVYLSDAAGDSRVRVVTRVDQTLHPSILYPLAIVRGADRPEVRKLLDYLRSPAGQAVFTRYGFRSVVGQCPG